NRAIGITTSPATAAVVLETAGDQEAGTERSRESRFPAAASPIHNRTRCHRCERSTYTSPTELRAEWRWRSRRARLTTAQTPSRQRLSAHDRRCQTRKESAIARSRRTASQPPTWLVANIAPLASVHVRQSAELIDWLPPETRPRRRNLPAAK